MSVEAYSWVIEKVRGIKPGARVVLLTLANNTDAETWECWPSLRYLQDRTEMSRAAVIRNLKVLEAAGLIQKEARFSGRGGQTSNCYRLMGGSQNETQGGAAGDTGGGGSTLPPRSLNHQSNQGDIDQAAATAEFEELFWPAYPNRKGKGAARKKYVSLRCRKNATMPPIADLLFALEGQKRSRQWRDAQYIPLPATWLNQERWDDEVEEREARGEPRQTKFRREAM